MDNRTFLGKRRDRALATLLGFKEREIDKFLDEKTSSRLRDQILYHFNDVVDLAFDLLGSESVYNEEFMRRLDEIYDAISYDEDDDEDDTE